MKKHATIILAFCLTNQVFAQSQGIKETNYRTSGSIIDSDLGSSISANGTARISLINYTGISLSAGHTKTTGKSSFNDSSADYASIGILLRKSKLGEIYAGYSYSKTYPNSGLLESSIDSYVVSGTYYIKDFDLKLTRTVSDPHLGPYSKIYTSKFETNYYLNNNLALGAATNLPDVNSSNIFITYQPEAWGKNTSITLNYQDSEITNYLTVSVTYYFTAKVSLKDRARKY